MSDSNPDQAQASESVNATAQQLLDTIHGAVIADEQFLETLLTGIVARGHVLLEDVPGTGKTLTARSLASALGLSFNRIQFTPDLLPSDITGSHVYADQTQTFEFTEGPIFANVVLADEINRASPKTQAALLEAMEAGQVSVDDETRELPDPFFVLATQNPVEQEGTFELPEAQRDRFIVKSEMGYPDRAGELELIDRRANRNAKSTTVERAVSDAELDALLSRPESVRVHQSVREYLVDIGRATRTDSRAAVGASPRGIQRLFETVRARAAIRGREYAVPDDVKRVVRPVLGHRIVLTPEARVQSVDPTTVVESALDSCDVPAVTEL